MMETAANFIRSGRYKKVIIVGADKMSSIVNYTDRATCPIFGDGAAHNPANGCVRRYRGRSGRGGAAQQVL